MGGLDFGFRSPFAAIWGHVDRDGILWLTGENYCRGRPPSCHARHLPRDVTWYADPSGANERCELICAGFTVRTGSNALRPDIAAVSARLEAGTLKVIEGCCPNLLAEASLYHSGEEGRDRQAEMPVDENNHALSALRYLISKLDARHLGKERPTTPDASPDESHPEPHPRQPDPWLRSAWTGFPGLRPGLAETAFQAAGRVPGPKGRFRQPRP